MKAALNVRNAAAVLVVAGLLVLPLYTSLSGNVFALTLFTRIVIFALAAASLNLIMGYGGMMSFGHAAYLGIGGYAVGILAAEGIGSGFIQWPVALLASALFALVIGALSLRTRGVYFIMITLAFAQMAYYVASGLARYGGPARRALFDLAHRQFALRHGGAGTALQRGANAGDWVSGHPLPARLLRDIGHDVRIGRSHARQQHRFRQSRGNVLDPLR